MRVLQIIDSLRPGGAERMAVSYANALSERVEGSYLCCTRMEGLLKKELKPEVGYLFLEKRYTLDLRAFVILRKYVKENKINLLQAHSSSYFLAVLIKLSVPGVKLVWQDHYGRNLERRKPGLLKQASKYSDGIISVNRTLKEWAEQNLNTSKVTYFRNFLPAKNIAREAVNLEGNGLRIICVANLRPQKDHLNLIKAFERVLGRYPDLSLHLVGKDENNAYSREIREAIEEKNLKGKIFLYGEQENVEGLIKQADLAVLSSESEGLPVALLEYGRAGVPVVCTQVGEIPEVVGFFGKLVPAKDPRALAEGILYYLEHREQRGKDAASFQNKVMQEYSEEAVIPEVVAFFEEILSPTD